MNKSCEPTDLLYYQVVNYYLSMGPNQMETISKIAENVDCSCNSVRIFINSVNNQKDINGEFSGLYKLILAHTIFKKDNVAKSHWANQQEYFQSLEQKRIKRENAKKIALSLYKRQQNKKG